MQVVRSLCIACCYSDIKEVLSGMDLTEVHVTTFVPAANCDLNAEISSPFHVVAISNEKPVIFNEIKEYLFCD